MTDQEAFDIVATHLLRQNSQSCRGDMCAYRGAGGRKCAIGILIPDEQYRESFEFSPVSELGSKLPCLLGLKLKLLEDLQNIHDYQAPPNWAIALSDIAEYHGLTFSPGAHQ